MTSLTLDEKRQRIAEADAVEQYRHDVAQDERQADAQRQAAHELDVFNVAAADAALGMQSYLERKKSHDAALVEWAAQGERVLEQRYLLKEESERVRNLFVRWATLGLHAGFITNPLGDPTAAAEDEIRRLTGQQNAYLLWPPTVAPGWARECLGFIINFVVQYTWRR